MPPEPSLATAQSPLRLALDTGVLIANWRALEALSGQARAGAAVKADAYGLGVCAVVPALRDAGCADFFVAHWIEVAPVAALVPPASIAVLHGPMTTADAAFARASGVRPVINSLAQVHLWLETGGGPCDLMVDTGINRLGVSMGELGDERIAHLDIDVLHSHLACADEDSSMNALQLARWQEARRHVRCRRASIANSAGIVLGRDYQGDLTRPGLSLYGGVPRGELAGVIRQVVRPMAAVMQVRQVEAGESVGYNATFSASRPMRIGTVAIGYADGYLRCWSDRGTMLAGGKQVPVIGRVSMDMTVVDLSAAPDVGEGDWLEIDYDLAEASRISGLSQYELLTSLGPRFSR
jgi:alanine racemase